jgi:hypothetical protein
MSDSRAAPKTMPKGGRKGGSSFPRINLQSAVGYAKRLVSKTHNAPQSKDIIYSGVLDGKGSNGNIKISALKQYGFITGDAKAGFSASEDARKLVAAPADELLPHYCAAVLRPKIFKALFDTYHGDAVTRAKLKQRAAALHVHPDETETCVDIYLQSAQLAGLVTSEDDMFHHVADSQVSGQAITKTEQEEPDGSGKPDEPGTATADRAAPMAAIPSQQNPDPPASTTGKGDPDRPRAIFNINVNLDSSLDTEKLQKQLELLKKFGAI